MIETRLIFLMVMIHLMEIGNSDWKSGCCPYQYQNKRPKHAGMLQIMRKIGLDRFHFGTHSLPNRTFSSILYIFILHHRSTRYEKFYLFPEQAKFRTGDSSREDSSILLHLKSLPNAGKKVAKPSCLTLQSLNGKATDSILIWFRKVIHRAFAINSRQHTRRQVSHGS